MKRIASQATRRRGQPTNWKVERIWELRPAPRWTQPSQKEKRKANCSCLEKLACVVIFPKELLP